MRPYLIASAVGLALAGSALAVAQQAAAPARVPGYLQAADVPRTSEIVPPPPAIGSPRQVEDMATYRALRKLEGSPRWTLAINDVDYGSAALVRDFNCALDVNVDAASAPKLAMLIRRVLVDTGVASSSGKAVFERKRPYVLAGEGNICVPKSDALAASLDYPSGHATLSWATGLVVAELAPDRATQVLTRARAYGESRLVCGVHTPSAVDAGRTTAATVVAVLHGSPEFRADMMAVREELDGLRRSRPKPDAGACKTEFELTAKSPY